MVQKIFTFLYSNDFSSDKPINGINLVIKLAKTYD